MMYVAHLEHRIPHGENYCGHTSYFSQDFSLSHVASDSDVPMKDFGMEDVSYQYAVELRLNRHTIRVFFVLLRTADLTLSAVRTTAMPAPEQKRHSMLERAKDTLAGPPCDGNQTLKRGPLGQENDETLPKRHANGLRILAQFAVPASLVLLLSSCSSREKDVVQRARSRRGHSENESAGVSLHRGLSRENALQHRTQVRRA